jgi:hypothetical protein
MIAFAYIQCFVTATNLRIHLTNLSSCYLPLLLYDPFYGTITIRSLVMKENHYYWKYLRPVQLNSTGANWKQEFQVFLLAFNNKNLKIVDKLFAFHHQRLYWVLSSIILFFGHFILSKSFASKNHFLSYSECNILILISRPELTDPLPRRCKGRPSCIITGMIQVCSPQSQPAGWGLPSILFKSTTSSFLHFLLLGWSYPRVSRYKSINQLWRQVDTCMCSLLSANLPCTLSKKH